MRDQASINAKISAALIGRNTGGGISKDNPNYDQICQTISDKAKERYAKRSFDQLGASKRRVRVIEEQNGQCARCGLRAWLDEPLALQVDHIDGDRSNNVRSNLQALCPNCHSQTETWGFRGRKHTVEARTAIGNRIVVSRGHNSTEE